MHGATIKILKWFFKKFDGEARTGFFWVNVGEVGGRI